MKPHDMSKAQLYHGILLYMIKILFFTFIYLVPLLPSRKKWPSLTFKVKLTIFRIKIYTRETMTIRNYIEFTSNTIVFEFKILNKYN